jgi:hypothetical protein
MPASHQALSTLFFIEQKMHQQLLTPWLHMPQ